MAGVSTLPTGPRPGSSPSGNQSSNSPAPSNSPSGTSGSGGSGGGGSGGGGSTPSWVKRQEREAKKAKREAAKRAQKNAELLMKQANAMKIALGKNGYKKTLQTQLKNIRLTLQEDEGVLVNAFNEGRTELERQSATNMDVAAEGATAALSNAGRERSEAMAQAISNGLGAVDMLRAQAASLRNWKTNAQGVAQSFTDTQNQLQSSAAELGNSFIAQRVSLWRDSEEARGLATNSYYDNRGAALTEIGNKLGEASTYWDLANQEQANKLRKRKSKNTSKQSVQYLRRAAKQTGKSYSQRELPDRMADWENPIDVDQRIDSRAWAAPEVSVREAEGATLRRWET